MIFFAIIFWTCVIAVMHTYLIFPITLRLFFFFSNKKKGKSTTNQPLANISILMAAFNEEKIIEEKIESIFKSNYPLNLLEVWVGSDNSTDKTNEILQQLQQKYPQLNPVFFNERNGKIKIINQLVQKAKADILIITDANVLFNPNTIVELSASINEEKVGLVDTHMMHSGLQNDGISKQENVYISNEVKTKYYEGQLWGCMMGPFGGCYAVKKSLFTPVPENFLVDDFFINMRVLEQGYQAINNPKAIVLEDVSNNLSHEFKRKIRIATGDFQNLRYFLPFTLKKIFNPIGFCFVSHKILRWFTPFILIIAFISLSLLAASGVSLYFYLWLAGLALVMLVLLERTLSLLKINIGALRLLTHFFYMNMALFIGFFRFLKGVKSSVWNPTPRLQAKK